CESKAMPEPGNVSCNPTADFQIYLFPVVYSLVFVFGLMANLVALYIFVFKIRNRSCSDVYIINLAAVDAIFVCILPCRIHYHLNQNRWVFGELACRITGTLYFTNIYVSIAFLTCICVDRYVATVHPHTYLRLRKTWYTLLVSSFVWAAAITTMSCLVLSGPGDVGMGHNGSCFENFSEDAWETRMTAYNVCALVFGSVIPFAVIMVCYPLVARRIARIRTATSRRALRVIYAILAIALICFLPHHVTHLLHLLVRRNVIQDCGLSDAIFKMRRVTMAVLSCNSCLDPIVYYFSTPKCKWSFVKWFRPSRARRVYTIY
uniref:Lysophosphatidic acid receptor 6-like n=1 Tax=Lepisosteus oculatus TaxID=7918 RepID=W5NNH3_LEPOC